MLPELATIAIGKLVEATVGSLTEKLYEAVGDRLSRRMNPTPVTPTVVEQNQQYQAEMQHYLVQQQRRDGQLLETAQVSHQLRSQEINLQQAKLHQESQWMALSFQQQQDLIAQASRANDLKSMELLQQRTHGDLSLQLKAQEMADLQRLEHLRLELMEKWHREELSQKSRQILQEWDRDTWNSKLNREETEDLLRPDAFQHRLLMLLSRPQMTVVDPLLEKLVHPMIRNTMKSLATSFSKQQLEIYCDYFKAPIEDTDVARLQKILGGMPTVVLYSDIIMESVSFHCVFWAMGRETRMDLPLLSWDFGEVLAATDQRDGAKQVATSIALLHKLLAVFITDWYYLNLDLGYQPMLLRPQFQETLEMDLRQWGQPYQVILQQIQREQQEKLRQQMADIERLETERIKREQETLLRQQQEAERQRKEAEARKNPSSFIEDLGNGIKLEMIRIPVGRFRDEKGNIVEIKEPFYMGKFQVTQGQWNAIMGANPSNFKKGDNYPVEQVSWNDCQAFLKKLNKKTSKTYRLPSEVEWEYACRSVTSEQAPVNKYCFGDDENQLEEYAWYRENSGQSTHPVGEKKPNQFELYDMHGNVWEWCQEYALRGGSWYGYANVCRSANRYRYDADVRSNNFGFRVVVV